MTDLFSTDSALLHTQQHLLGAAGSKAGAETMIAIKSIVCSHQNNQVSMINDGVDNNDMAIGDDVNNKKEAPMVAVMLTSTSELFAALQHHPDVAVAEADNSIEGEITME